MMNDNSVMAFLAFLILAILDPRLISQSHASVSSIQNNVTAILDKLQRGYDKRVRPNYGGPPVEVGVTMFIISISSVSEVQMDFTTDFYFRQYWKDPRLAFDRLPGVERIMVSTEYLKSIWVPDTFFANEKSSYLHMATTSNEFLRITHLGEINRSIRLTITASCPMNLQYFPMDRQLCSIEIESFGFAMSEITYHWLGGKKAVAVSPDVQLPQFNVLGYRQGYRVEVLTTGNYSRMSLEIQFVRSMGYYMIQIYIPSGLIVIISWVSFWLNRQATPARVSLGVTTVLTMTTLMSSTNAALPKISYVKSIDIFLGTCFVMVFASLLEYAAVGYVEKRIRLRKTQYQMMQKLVESRKKTVTVALDAEMEHTPRQTEVRFLMGPHGKAMPIHETSGHPMPSALGCQAVVNNSNNMVINGPRIDEEATAVMIPPGKDLNKLWGFTPSDIDKYSRVVFPVCFICFNLMYWIIYLHISDVVADDLEFIDRS
ncbi:gamma-aminobutyric acid receptor subunit beta [Daphnia magna]|nr:gamma-aminobutyric acid receptor subunit beta [Daphnia magna]